MVTPKTRPTAPLPGPATTRATCHALFCAAVVLGGMAAVEAQTPDPSTASNSALAVAVVSPTGPGVEGTPPANPASAASLEAIAQPEEPPPSVVLGSRSGDSQGLPQALRQALLTDLAPRLTAEVRPGPVSLPADSLHHLPHLPNRLSDHAAADPESWPTAYRYVLVVRPDSAGARAADRTVLEVALVDTAQSALLGFDRLPVSTAAAGDAIVGWLAGVLPELVIDPGAERLAASYQPTDGAVVRDAPAEPWTASVPRSLEPAARPTAPRPTAAVPRPRPRVDGDDAAGAALPEAEALLRRFATEAVGAGGLGSATAPPQVPQQSYRVLLVPPEGTLGPEAHQPLRAEITVYAVGPKARIEMAFSRPVHSRVVHRQGTFAAVDILGYTVTEECLVDIGRSGLLNLLVKPVGEDRVRLGFQCTAAGEVTFEGELDGRLVVATAEQTAGPSRSGSRLAGSYLGHETDFTVTRSFTGMSSWYGGRFHGRRTASGEVFNMYEMTAAHRTLPLGTMVRVTNLGNGRSVIAKVNDRGPFVGGRVLDVSAGCADALGFRGRGVARVQVDVLRLGG